MFKKILGLTLLAFGLLIILWSLYSSYNIFTGQAEIPEVFTMSEKENLQGSESEFEKIINQAMGEQLKGILSLDFLPQLFSLMAWAMFSGLAIFAGSQISGLGINLLK